MMVVDDCRTAMTGRRHQLLVLLPVDWNTHLDLGCLLKERKVRGFVGKLAGKRNRREAEGENKKREREGEGVGR